MILLAFERQVSSKTIMEERRDAREALSDEEREQLDFDLFNQYRGDRPPKDVDEIRNLLNEGASPIGYKDEDQTTAFHFAAFHEDTENVLEMMRGMTQDELTLENGNGWDALNIAAAFETKGIVDALLVVMKRDDVLRTNPNKNAALSVFHSASRNRETDVLEALIEYVDDDDLVNTFLTLQDANGFTPIFTVASTNAVPVAELFMSLVDNDVVLLPEKNGRNMLQAAAWKGFGEVLAVLIDKVGIEALGIQDSEGKTALHYAVRKEQPEMVDFLLNAMREEDVALRNDDGHTALELCTIKKFTENVEVFQKHGYHAHAGDEL